MNWKKLEVLIYSFISRSPIGMLSRMSSNKFPRMILAYHGVQPNHPFCVHPKLFVQHMEHIKQYYNVVAIDKVTDDSSPLDKPDVSITFDDAYGNLIDHALPVLAEAGIPAMVYAPVAYLGKQNEWDRDRPELIMPIMSRNELKLINSWGFSVGSHTINHIRLRNRELAILRKEIGESKRELEDLIGGPVLSFAYPHGGRKDMDDNADAVVRESGYTSAVTTHFGRFNARENRFKLRRIIIWPTDSLEVFRIKLAGNFDWLGPKEDIVYTIRSTINKLNI